MESSQTVLLSLLYPWCDGRSDRHHGQSCCVRVSLILKACAFSRHWGAVGEGGKVLQQPFYCPPVVYSWPGTEAEATNFVVWVTKELREQALSSSAVGYVQTGSPQVKIWRGYCWFPTLFSPVLQGVKKHACGWGGSAWKITIPHPDQWAGMVGTEVLFRVITEIHQIWSCP